MDKEFEVLKIIKDPVKNVCYVQVGKRRFVSLSEINHPKAEGVILEALEELVRFAGGREALEKIGVLPLVEPEPETPPPPPKVEEEPTAEVDTTPPVDEVQAKFLESLAKEPALGREADSPKPPRFGSLFRRSRSKEPAEAAETGGSMVQQIDAIIQHKLLRDPALSDRIIKIGSSLDGGLEIRVDGQVFEGVSEVTDPEARALIQEAIRTWEKRAE